MEFPVDGRGDGPEFAVADGFAGGGVDLAVVAAGDDDVAGVGVLSVSDGAGHGGVELTGGGAGGLDGVVDQVDVLVGGGGDGDRLVVLVAVEPQVGDVVEVFVELAGPDSAVRDVGLDRARVAVSQFQGCGGFPGLVEAVDAGEVVGPSGGAQLVEHPAATDGLELVGVADEGESPVLSFGEADEAFEGAGADHPGFVDDDRRPGREPIPVVGWPVVAFPLVEQFGEGVGRVRRSRVPGFVRLWRTAPHRTPSGRGRGGRRTAAWSVVVLPVPAGPTASTSRSWPATAAATSAWRTSSPVRSTLVDGVGSSSWASIAQARISVSSARTRWLVRCVEIGSIHSDLPSDWRRGAAATVGSSSTHEAMISSHIASSSSAHACPLIAGCGRCPSHRIRRMSARFHVDPPADSASITAAGTTPTRQAVELEWRSSEGRRSPGAGRSPRRWPR